MHTPYTLFADESAVQERFLGFGAIVGPTPHMSAANDELAAFCEAKGMGRRSLSWKSCSRNDLDRYRQFVELFEQLRQSGMSLDFRAMVVDTRRNPLKHPASGADSEERGFYKFYFTFLSRSLGIAASAPARFELVLGSRTDRYAFNAEIIESTVGGHLRRKFGVPLELTTVGPADPRENRCHQMADILLGATTYRFNRATRDPEGKSRKRELYEEGRQVAGKHLDEDFMPDVRPFNVWAWAPPGQSRWARGARGVV